MRCAALLFVILTCFVACSPLTVSVPQTEIIEFTATPDLYVGNDIQIENAEIQADREIEAYWRLPASSLWQFVIDADISFGNGLMLINDPPTRLYENNIIRIIITWYADQQPGEE